MSIITLCLTVLLTTTILPTTSATPFGNALRHWLWPPSLSHESSSYIFKPPTTHVDKPSQWTTTITVSNLRSKHLPSYILGATSSNRTNERPIVYARQMMHRPEVDLIASYLRPTDVYLEFGVGGSTQNFAPLVARAYSIEHNCEWASHVAQSVASSSAYNNLRIKCVSVPAGFREWGTLSSYEHANYKQFREYVDAVDSLGEFKFDKVFIDGRARLGCALKVLPYLRDDSVVFMHDFYVRTEQYGAVLQYYQEVGRVLATQNADEEMGPVDQPQGLVVLRRRKNASLALTSEQIDAVYESVNWRGSFGPPLTRVSGWVVYVSRMFDWRFWKRARSPDGLVRLVQSDWIKITVIYVVLCLASYVVSARREKKAGLDDLKKVDKEFGVKVEPKFVETDGMKAAQARRKRFASSGSGTLKLSAV